jgi:hypothetical protein
MIVVLLAVAPVAAVPGAAAPDTGSAVAATTDAPARPAVAAATQAQNETLDGVGIVTDVAPAGDGGEYLVGTSGPRTGNVTVTRRAPSGEIRWQQSFGTNDTVSGAVGVAAAPDAGVYVLEQVRQGTIREPAAESPTLRLRRLAPDGSTTWTVDLGNASRYGTYSDLVATADGGVAVATAVTDEERQATRLRRVTPRGETSLDRSYAGGVPTTLTRGDDGDLLVAGEIRFGEAWLLRVDDEGAVELNETLGGAFADRRVVGAVPTGDGGVLVAGSAETTFASQRPWAARLTADGDVTWSRTFDADAQRTYPRAAVPTDEGLLVLHDVDGELRERGSLLTHVTPTGAYGAAPVDTDDRIRTSAMHVDGGDVELYATSYENRTATARVTTTALPAAEATTFRADADATTGETFYRGQNLALSGNATYGLYEIPDEYDEFDEPRRVRLLRDTDGDGEIVFETATLTQGQYAVRNVNGSWWQLLGSDAGPVATEAEAAAFELADQRVRLVDPDAGRYPRPSESTVVETYDDDESTVTFGVRSTPENFTAEVSLHRLQDGPVSADAVGAALESTEDGWGGPEAPDHVAIGDGADRNLTLDAGALEAGLYRVSVTGAETADAADPARTTLVVVTEERPVSLTAANTSLSLPANGSADTTLTLAGADAGVSAIRLTSNRTGAPAVGLRLDFTDAVDYRSARGSAGWSSDRSTASTQSLDVESAPNGSFEVATFEVRDSEYRDSAGGTNTARVGLAWVVDENGVPYSVPDDIVVTYEVTDAEADGDGSAEGGSGGSSGGSGTASGSASASGSESA